MLRSRTHDAPLRQSILFHRSQGREQPKCAFRTIVEALMIASASRLRKHADYQRVYSASRKQFSRQMSYFFTPRAADAAGRPDRGSDAAVTGPRVGLTVGKVMGKAVDRSRIKRRMREAVRQHLNLLTVPVDVVLHPRRTVLDLKFADLSSEVAQVFRAIEKAAKHPQRTLPAKLEKTEAAL